MGCIEAYREALMRDFTSAAPSAPASTPGPSQCQAAETGRESGTGQPASAVHQGEDAPA